MAADDIRWFSMDEAEALRGLASSSEGLTQEEVGKRLAFHGPNSLLQKRGRSPWLILLDQFRDILILLLIVSSAIAIALGQVIDGSLILTIVVLNGIFGFIQDYKAQSSIEELKKMSKPKALVVRAGAVSEIDSEGLVPGDILILEEGDSIQADARIIESVGLRIDESSLTGESLPQDKGSSKVDAETVLPDRTDMVYRGTTVVGGRGTVVVVSTGMNTSLGRIAQNIQEIPDTKTPFQRQMDVLGGRIGVGIVAVSIFVGAVIFLTTDTKPLNVLLIAIALGVAAIPEGLPAVITLSLALGSKRMLKKRALLRRLPVAEALGSVDVICTDKTGTITENMMTVRRIYFDGRKFDVTGSGYHPEGDFRIGDAKADPSQLEPLLVGGLLNNNSRVVEGGFLGDPTEIALRVAAVKGGVESSLKRVDEIAFSSQRRLMTTVHESPQGRVSYTKGAPETVLERCDQILENGKARSITPEDRARVLLVNGEFASEALRVIGFAYNMRGEPHESGMVFLGLQGMIDPPRREVRGALEDCRSAGIRVIMMTGDNKLTAQAVAREIGLESEAVDGKELDRMGELQLNETVKRVSIFARVSPQNKLAVLQALQAQGHVVAMTGDGVNDAPALKAADVGVSMGIRGTEVAKQTSDIILLDDNFATIRDAIVEGRRIFDNVRKFIRYLFPCNLAEVAIVFMAALPFIEGRPLVILTAVQLLWINVATDGLPALALGVDPPAPGIMGRKPRKKGENIIDGYVASSILFNGMTMTVIVLGLFYLSNPLGDFARAQTIAVTSIVMFKLVRVQRIRFADGISIFSNKWLLGALASSLLMHLVLLYTPAGGYFKLVPLGLADWAMILAGMAVFSVLSATVGLLYHGGKSRSLR